MPARVLTGNGTRRVHLLDSKFTHKTLISRTILSTYNVKEDPEFSLSKCQMSSNIEPVLKAVKFN